MIASWQEIRIDESRFVRDFEELSEIGSTGDGGVDRPALSEANLESRAWFRQKAEQAGLEFYGDGAGNRIARLPSADDTAKVLLMGSHLDSVPNGGRFDGALGVMTGLEVLRTIKEAELELPVHLEVVDFTDEEGTLISFLGSYALAGKLEERHFDHPRGSTTALSAALSRGGLTRESILSAKRDPESLYAYLELHVEQGKRLWEQGQTIGIVAGITGIRFYQLKFLGQADHAGSVSMEERLDASWGASDFVLSARDITKNKFPECLVNIGQMNFEPGVYNIVPQKAILSLEFRAPNSHDLEALDESLMQLAKQIAERYGLGIQIVEIGGHREPAGMDERIQAVVKKVVEAQQLSYMTILSGPGHDAQAMYDLCPSGMIFVPSVNGTSHSPKEFTEMNDCIQGANVLLQTALELALNGIG